MNYPKRHNDEKLWRYRVGDPNHRHIWISSVQFSSVAQSCPALCNPMNHSTPGLAITNPRSLLKFMSIESVMPSSLLILCCPLILPPIPPSIRVFSNDSTLRMRWPKYWSFSFSISPSNEHPGLISFCRGPAPVDPGWSEGGDGVGILEKTYLITDIEGD